MMYELYVNIAAFKKKGLGVSGVGMGNDRKCS